MLRKCTCIHASRHARSESTRRTSAILTELPLKYRLAGYSSIKTYQKQKKKSILSYRLLICASHHCLPSCLDYTPSATFVQRMSKFFRAPLGSVPCHPHCGVLQSHLIFRPTLGRTQLLYNTVLYFCFLRGQSFAHLSLLRYDIFPRFVIHCTA